ncbi:MAG: leucyl aminopeptidase [Gammaproteobacteria bacterium]|nr:leucyl aminopeptidase [Gammaproteobacteria bacterium]
MTKSVPQPAIVSLFCENYARCRIGPGQHVVVLSEGEQLRDYAVASVAAAQALGAEAVDLNIPGDDALDANARMANIGNNNLSKYPAAIEQCKRADIVIDHMLLLFSPEQIAMQAAGTRVLMVVEPVEILARLQPQDGLHQRVEAAEFRLQRARRLRFTNDAGTDVTYELGGKHIMTEYGFTDQPGRWDHWPGGFLATMAREREVNGRVVMDRGDILFPQKKTLREPIEFVIEHGVVRAILGGTEAAALREFMEAYCDPRAYAVSHIGWGLNERCVWNSDLPGIGMDGRAYYGNVLFSLGPDTEFGGTNDTACHLDLPMQNCSLWLDDELILARGEVLPADMRPHQH